VRVVEGSNAAAIHRLCRVWCELDVFSVTQTAHMAFECELEMGVD
jgi:hypothetical protein